MLSSLASFSILGKPLIMYGGILTFLLMLFTASIPGLQKKWPNFFNFPLHILLARITIVFALIHGVLGFSIYFIF